MALPTNLSFFAVPIAFAIAQFGGSYAKIQGAEVVDYNEPSGFLAALEKSDKLDKRAKGRIRRAEAAEANSLKALALFGPGVALAHIAKVPVETINRLSLAYLVLRCAYMYVYIWLNGNRKLFILRPMTYWSSVFVAIGLYVSAGLKG